MIVLNRANDRKGKGWLATIGFFDGVHHGHRHLIHEMKLLAQERELQTAVFTFPIHPRMVLEREFQPKLLNTFDEKIERLSTTDVDYCVVIDFTKDLAAYSAKDFIVHVLSKEWDVRSLLIGYDHRFGHSRSEGFDEYVAYGKTCHMEILQATPYHTPEGGIISSSRIRQCLVNKEVEKAANWLSYPYRLSGHVIKGYEIGHKLGFPTANLLIDDPLKIWPGMGIYAVWGYVDGHRYKGMLSIGSRPTLHIDEISIEVHLLDFSADIYGKQVDVEFIQYLRDSRKFEQVEGLIEQLKKDRMQVQAILS